MRPEVPRVVRSNSEKNGYRIEGERRAVTVLFADIRGFTAFVERVPAEEAVSTLNAIYSTLHAVVTSEQGIVDRFLGEGMMAVFGVPLPVADHASVAARAALRARSDLDRLFARDTSADRERLQVGFALNTGVVIAGTVGTNATAEYRVIGDALNVAARLLTVATPGQILLGAGSATLLTPELEVADRGVVDLQEIGPTPIFELVGPSVLRRERSRAP